MVFAAEQCSRELVKLLSMSPRRRAPPEQALLGDDPIVACTRTIASVRSKADTNERIARCTTATIIVSSALIPVSLIAAAQGHPFLWGQLLPALLAASSAAAAGLLQFERPHERWQLYRRYQRQLEDEMFRYVNGIEPYDLADADRKLQLGRAVSVLRSRMHQDWSAIAHSSALAASTARDGNGATDG